MRAELESWLHGQWSKKGLLAFALSPLSLIYLAVVKNRARRFHSEKLPVPVIVVGNIYVGGTGKTPVTIELVKALAALGYHPGVISRGYGRKDSAPVMVVPESPAAVVGDEPLLIVQATGVPAAVARNRMAAGRMLLSAHPEIDVLISDDGLQHLQLARDIELAVVGARGIGNGWVLPAGPLREPPSRLDTVDAIILNATNDTIASRTPRFAATSQLGKARRLADGKEVDIDDLARDIAETKAKVVAAHDIECAAEMKLGDHFSFETNPFATLNADYIFVTGKDAVKCQQKSAIAKDPRLWTVDLEMHLDPYLVELVVQKLKALPAAH